MIALQVLLVAALRVFRVEARAHVVVLLCAIAVREGALRLSEGGREARLYGRQLVEVLALLDVVLDLLRVLVLLLQLPRVEHRLPTGRALVCARVLVDDATHDFLVFVVDALGLLLLGHVVERARTVLAILRLDRALKQKGRWCCGGRAQDLGLPIFL